MNPELSRRAARVWFAHPIRSLPYDDRLALADRIDSASSFEQLSPEDQQIILAAEREMGVVTASAGLGSDEVYTFSTDDYVD